MIKLGRDFGQGADEDTCPQLLRDIGDRFVQQGMATALSPTHMSLVVCHDEHIAAPEAELGCWPVVPYNRPGFSQRVVALHLDQTHDQSSMRKGLIEQYAKWIVPDGTAAAASSVLHLMCGPGLYARPLHALGVARYVGIDVNPDAIAYAKRQLAWGEFTFKVGDCRTYLAATNAETFGLVLFTYEALNAFCPVHWVELVRRAARRLAPNGTIVCDMRLRRAGQDRCARQWLYCPHGSVFDPAPHLLLNEYRESGGRRMQISSFWVIDPAGRQRGSEIRSTVRAYDRAELKRLAAEAGLTIDEFNDDVLDEPEYRRAFLRMGAGKGNHYSGV